MSTSTVRSRQIGDFLVTALSDGKMPVSFDLLMGIDPAEATRIQSNAGKNGPEAIQINSYLIQGGGKTVLVDAGTGGRNGSGGAITSVLKLMGIQPADIDSVLLTHGHPDHIGGLLDSNGGPIYPNAQLYLHTLEAEHWLDERRYQAANERGQRNFSLMRETLAAYAPNVHLFNDGQIITGISAVELPGHTPGHSGFCIHSAGQRLLIWGDIVHFPAIQSTHPSVAIRFDWDPALAEQTRRKIMHKAAQGSWLIAGMHLDSPGFARVYEVGEGYRIISVAENESEQR